jgi:flagellar biogenesis protein FliO
MLYKKIYFESEDYIDKIKEISKSNEILSKYKKEQEELKKKRDQAKDSSSKTKFEDLLKTILEKSNKEIEELKKKL